MYNSSNFPTKMYNNSSNFPTKMYNSSNFPTKMYNSSNFPTKMYNNSSNFPTKMWRSQICKACTKISLSKTAVFDVTECSQLT